MIKLNSLALTSALLIALTASGCGDDGNTNTQTGGTATTTAGVSTNSNPTPTNTQGVNTDSTGTATGPQGTTTGMPSKDVYAILSQIFAPNAQSTYILTVESMAAQAAPMEVTGGIEVSGRAIGIGLPSLGLGALIVGSDDGPLLRRYDLDAAGKFKPTPTQLSLAPYGVTGIGEYQGQFHVVSATKAYYFDGKTSLIAVFNPTTMTLIKKIDLALTRPNTILTFAPRAVRSGNKLVMGVGWRSSDNKQIPSETAVVSVDTTTDVATIATDTRCGYVRDATVADDGKVYLVTDAYASAVHRLAAAAGPKPCVLRFDPVTAAYDTTFFVDANTLAGAPLGSSVPGPGNTALVSVLDEALAGPMIKPDTSPRALSAMPVWNWHQMTLGDTPALNPVPNAPKSTGSQLPLEMGTQIFLPTFTRNPATSSLVELTEQGVSTAPPLVVKGRVFSATKVR